MSELMINDTANRTPDLIAAEINTIREQTQKVMIYNSIEIGRRLVEAKKLVNHGEWGNWLEEKVDYSQRTANNLMKIYEEYNDSQALLFGEEANSQSIANIGYTQAVALLNIPAEERDDFIKEHNVPDMSIRELKQVIKERDQAIEEKKTALAQFKEKQKEAIKLFEEKFKAENNLIEADREKKEAEKRVTQLEQQLKEKPIEVNAETIIEKVPEEIEKELKELREYAKKVTEADEATVKFSVYFNELVKSFDNLLKTLKEIKDPENQAKYKNAVIKLIEKMSERL